MRQLTMGSLFSGIGGLDLGLEAAGLGPLLWQVERDPFCRSVLAEHWPEVRRYDDVQTVGAAVLEPVDVICGGFPCQDVSLAGRGAGLAGERSSMWFEYLRIVEELRPRYVVIENVLGLVRRGLDTVVAGLDGAGYAVVGTRITAASVGALHERERLALVAYTDRPRLEKRVEQQARAQRPAAQRGRLPRDPWAAEPAVGRVAYGVSGRVDQLRALGNAVVPQVAQVIGELVWKLEAERTAR